MRYTARQAQEDSHEAFMAAMTNAEKAAERFVDDFIAPKIKLAASQGIGRIRLPQNSEADTVSVKYWWPVSECVIESAADTSLFQNTVWKILKDAGYAVGESNGNLVIRWF